MIHALKKYQKTSILKVLCNIILSLPFFLLIIFILTTSILFFNIKKFVDQTNLKTARMR